MEIYLEYVLIDNMVINGLILILTISLLRLNVKKTRIFISSLIGTGFAIITPFVVMPVLSMFLFRALIAVVMLSVIKKYQSIIEFASTYITFLAITFSMGGACFAILNAINAKTTSNGMLIYNAQIPVGFIVLIIAGYSYLMLNLIKNFYKKKSINNFLYKVSIRNKAKTFTTNAFLDTGNRLINKQNNKPVIIINFKVFNELYKNVKFTDILLGNLQNLPLKNCKYISINGAGGKKSKMLIFETDELQIFLQDKVNTIKEVTLGLTLAKFKDQTNYNVLLNPLLFNL